MCKWKTAVLSHQVTYDNPLRSIATSIVVDGVHYDNLGGALCSVGVAVDPTSNIEWVSDGSFQQGGFEVCRVQDE